MKMQFGTCPQCKMEVSKDRLSQAPIVCNHCGYTDRQSTRVQDEVIYKSFMKTSIALCLTLVVGFIQAVNWDKYSLEIVLLKGKELSGLASLTEYKRMVQICNERKKWDCVESALTSAYSKSPQTELETLAELGQLQFKRGKFREAAGSFATYFQQGGLNLDATYDYARALSEVGQSEQASQVYSQILQAKPETLQITVAQNYIRHLMKNQKNMEAKKVLEDIRKSGTNANMFMEKEYQQLTGVAN